MTPRPADAGGRRVAVLTGAAGGIGHAIARRLAGEGIAVLAVDRDHGSLDRLIADLAADDHRDAVRVTSQRGAGDHRVNDHGANDHGADDRCAGDHGVGEGAPGDHQPGDPGPVSAIAADLADSAQRNSVVPAALDRFGRVDVLINNAADHGSRTPFLELPIDEWERILATNLTAAAVLAQQAARDMITRASGVIINITAIQERLPLATYTAYGASKGGVSALTRALAAELSPLGIRVNAIAPGMISTPSLDQTRDAAAPSPTLLGRDGSPDEIAAAVSFLTSADSSFITGTVLTVDGGRTISRRDDPLAARFDPAAGGAR